jgi:hypothetical protein
MGAGRLRSGSEHVQGAAAGSDTTGEDHADEGSRVEARTTEGGCLEDHADIGRRGGDDCADDRGRVEGCADDRGRLEAGTEAGTEARTTEALSPRRRRWSGCS